MHSLLEELNTYQQEAVKYSDSPLLVLAGAGAGKTRVITYRIAYLIKNQGIKPYNILAVTFTNKAAGEMKSRIKNLIGLDAQGTWIGTFHSIGLNILRHFSDQAGLEKGFGIIDQDDRLRLIKDILKRLDVDSKKYSPKSYLTTISDFKNTLDFVDNKYPNIAMHKIQEVFEAYQDDLHTQKLIDYDDMLSLSLRVLKNDSAVLEYYQDLCKYVLVDEYQDTNAIQLSFLRTIVGKTGNICVVGDDDQSIYGWRGADLENILYFERYFNGVKEIKLIDNYRSSSEILDIANKVISNNVYRRGKELVSKALRKGDILHSKLVDEISEAEFVAKKITSELSKGTPADEIAILYRTNAQSRNFEVALSKHKIHHKVVGGVSFYQRREIKDILSYLRLYDNPYDENSFLRASKTPPKGIGEMLLNKVKSYKDEHNTDFITSIEATIPYVSHRQAEGLGIIHKLMHKLNECKGIADMVNSVIEDVKYKDYLLRSEDAQDAKIRIENLEELYNSAVVYAEQNPEGSLTDFLSTATLLTSGDTDRSNAVSLMTIHAAKGLEFESIYLTGLEEGVFPLNSQDESDTLEEERRLCYVGITRAKSNLILTNVTSRMIHGKRQVMRPSRFLIEAGFISSSYNQNNSYFSEKNNLEDPLGFKKGQLVTHEAFGDGIVMNTSGSGDSAKVDVLFKKYGMKKLIARFLKA